MIELTTVSEVKSRLRIDHDDDDTMLAGLILAASGIVVNYLKSRAAVVLDLDSNGELTSGSEVPPPVEAATIMMVGYLYRNPDGDPDKAFSHGMLPVSVTSLLYTYRDPAIA